MEQWKTLSQALQQQGHRVLPKSAECYPYQSEVAYRQALDNDLAQATLLIQLLGTQLPWSMGSRLVRFQAEAAKSEALRRQLSLLSWRDPDINLDNISDPVLKQLLTETSALDFETFCLDVINRLSLPVNKPRSTDDDWRVFPVGQSHEASNP